SRTLAVRSVARSRGRPPTPRPAASRAHGSSIAGAPTWLVDRAAPIVAEFHVPRPGQPVGGLSGALSALELEARQIDGDAARHARDLGLGRRLGLDVAELRDIGARELCHALRVERE